MPNKYAVIQVTSDTSDRSKQQGYDISVQSWHNWTDKFDNVDYWETGSLNTCPQLAKYDIYGWLQEYDAVCVVDADTVVSPRCPFFFHYAQKNILAVRNFGSMEWVCRTTEVYQTLYPKFKTANFNYDNYINTGFVIYPQSHAPHIKQFYDWAISEQDSIMEFAKKYGMGIDQSLFNLFLFKQGLSVGLLPYTYNVQDLTRRGCFRQQDLFWSDMGYVFHFNCGVKPSPREVMKKLYKKLWEPNV